jgi:hypothetical protein
VLFTSLANALAFRPTLSALPCKPMSTHFVPLPLFYIAPGLARWSAFAHLSESKRFGEAMSVSVPTQPLSTGSCRKTRLPLLYLLHLPLKILWCMRAMALCSSRHSHPMNLLLTAHTRCSGCKPYFKSKLEETGTWIWQAVRCTVCLDVSRMVHWVREESENNEGCI